MRSYFNSGLFLAAILLFFLPFLEVRCGDGSRFAKMNGFDMAFARGPSFESEESEEFIADNEELMQKMQAEKKQDWFTLGVLLALGFGIVIQFIPKFQKPVFSILISFFSVVLLSVMMYAIRKVWDQQMAVYLDNPFFKNMFYVRLHFGIGLWLVIGLNSLIIIQNIIFFFQDRRASFLQEYKPENN
ncbi:MAG: hypothetical protein K1X77_01865 [Bacteroidia bacterium]|nr:hypothetical protein [Bacteroidia bacterium]